MFMRLHNVSICMEEIFQLVDGRYYGQMIPPSRDFDTIFQTTALRGGGNRTSRLTSSIFLTLLPNPHSFLRARWKLK